MADVKLAYGAETAITITLTSLASAASATSSTLDNTTTRFMDYLVSLKVVLGASGVATTGTVEVYAAASSDGTDFEDVENDHLIGVIDADTNSATQIKLFSVAAAFGGTMPPYWKLRVYNNTGASLASSGNEATYRGVYATSV